jgi:carbonic anhydrase
MNSNCNSEDLISPINITKENVMSNRNILAYGYSLDINYNNSYVNVHNKGSYISLDYQSNTGSNKTNYHIKVNNAKMMINEIRLYFPSIHKYDNIEAEGEMLIIHSGNGSNCIISVPITAKKSSTIGENTLLSILENALLSIPNKNESSTLNITNFNISSFVPTNTPYYYYQGQLIFDPCTQKYNYIVFHKNDYSIQIDKNVLTKIKMIFKQKPGNVASSKNLKILHYNKQGATNINLNGTDDIYIECKPVSTIGFDTSDKDQSLSETDNKSINTGTKKTNNITLKTLSDNPAFDVLVSFVGLFILYTTGKYVLSYMKKNK